MRYKNLISLLIIGILIAFVSSALATGDGRLLRRSLEDTCHGCHKTDKNARFLQDGSVNPDSIKTHNSDWAGKCSNTSFLNRFDCEANSETWTPQWSAQGGWGKEGTKYGAIVCTTCHTTHSTRNIYLIREIIRTPDNSNWASSGSPTVNVDFRYFSGSAGVTPGLMGDDTGGHATSTRICEVCHSQTKYHRYNTAGQDGLDHQNANDCTVCHKHKKGFNPDFAASCGDCHGYPPSNNEVTKGSGGLVVNDTQYVAEGETGRRVQFGSTAQGAHTRHNSNNVGCSSCHYEGKAGAPPDPKRNTKIEIGFYLSGTTLGGTYKAPAFTYNTLYSIQPTGTTTYQADPARTCSNLYCHSDGGNYAGTITYRTVTWDSTLSAPTCDKCHGNQAGVYVTTDKHPQHINTSTYDYKCYECHANTTDANNNISGSGHVNRTKDVVWRTNSGAMNPDASAYSRPNCSNTYCHSLGDRGSSPYNAPNTTAAWNGSSLDCSGCHGGDASKANKVNTRAHLAHINDTSNQVGWNIGCAECHSATVSNNTTIASYTRHVDKKLQVKFDNSLNRNTDNPTYNGTSTTGSGGAEKNAGAAGFTCSNVYCHSIGNLDSSGNVIAAGGVSFRSIAWDGSPISCTGCHGDSGSNKAHPIYTSGAAGSTTANSHVKHVDDNQYACDYCHLTTTTSTALPPTSVIQAGAHLNRVENVSFKTVSGQTGSYNSSTKTCSSTYCHGGSNMVWGDAGATNCATCHDSQGAGGTAIYSPKHTTHVDTAGYDYSCEMCHAVAGTNHATGPASGTNPGGDPVGANQTTEISFTSLSDTGWTNGSYRGSASTYKYRSLTKDPYTNNNISPTYADGGSFSTDSTNPGIKYTTNGTCNNIWCHSTAVSTGNTYKSVQWNATLNCGSCHNQAGDASPNWTSPHTKHVNTYTQYTCNNCHAAVASNNTTITSRTLHVDATKNVAFNTWTGGTWSGTQCSNTYCHSKGTSLTSPFSHSAISWSGTVGCGSCHGEGSANGSPSYTNGSPKENSHVKHVSGSGQTCDYCHVNVVNSSNVITNTSLHVNQAYNVDFLSIGGKTGTYDSGTKTCSSTYCHGTGPSVAWGGTTNCASCHGANNNGDLSVSTTAGHALHYNITAIPSTMTDTDAHTSSAYAYACQNCHPTASHSTGPVSADQDAQISTGAVPTKIQTYTAGGTGYTDAKGFRYTYGTCSTVCHTRDGASGSPIVTAVWNGARTTPNCGVCHNKAGDASPVWSSPHTKHINTYTQYTCNNCHDTVAANNTTLQSTTTARQLHPNASKNVAFNTWTGGTWSGTQCSNTYCHSNGTTVATGSSPTHGAISWSGTTTCSSCHTGPTTGPNYTNGSPKANSHAKHTGSPWNYICSECHSSVVNSSNQIISNTLHVNKAYNVNSSKIGSYTFQTTGGTCSNITCHGSNTAQWGTTLKCSDCHLGTSDVDNWSNDGTLAIVSSTQWSYSGHGKTSGTYDATGNPAANFPGAAGTGDPCLYCHDSSAEHNITGTTNPIRLSNLNWNGRGLNGNCLICHATGSPGYDPDGAGTVYSSKNATKKIDKYHYGTDHSTTYSGGQWCWDCHDPHGDSSSTSGPIVMVHLRPASKSDTYGRPTETSSVDVVFNARTSGADYGATTSPYNKICNVCHTQTTYYRNNLGNNGHYTDTCTGCHSHSSNTTYDGNAFSGAGGESSGGSACNTCHSAIYNRMNDTTANVVYKHYMNNASATNTVIAQPATLGSTSDTNRRCLTCHVDHNIFRPDINVNGARAKNLRLDISMTPTTTTGFTDTDYDSTAANGGICLSCHYTQQSKAISTPNGATIVPPIPYPNAGTIAQARDLIRNSTHNYAVVSGTFKDGTSFKAVCLKCHDDTLTKQYQSSDPKFGLHQSGRNTLSAVMGSATFKDFVQGRVTSATSTSITTDQSLTKDYTGYHVVVTKSDGTLSQRQTITSNTTGANSIVYVSSWAWTPSANDFFEIVAKIVPVEDMCFSCHSQGSNSTGSGLDKANNYKPSDGKDFYNTATMNNKIEQMFNLFNADSGRLSAGGTNQTSASVCTNSTVTANEFVGYLFRTGSVVKSITSNTATTASSTCQTNYGLANSMTYSWSGGVTLTAGAAYKVGKASMHPLDTLGRHTPDESLNAPSTRPTGISQAWNVGDTGGSAATAAATYITDTAKRWNTNSFTNLKIYFASGTCSGQSSTITSNGWSQINFSSFGCTPAAGDTYYIGKRHVSCTDCHNTHSAQPNPAGTVSSATNTAPNNITITDSTKTTEKTGWAADKWKGYLVMVTKANGFRQIRQIVQSTTTSTGTTYRVGLAWNTSQVPAAGDTYQVFKLDGTTPPSGKGVWGVQITFTAPTTKNTGENFAPSSTYTYTKVYDSPYQRDLCMKCHSYYGFLNAPPSSVSGIGTINTMRPATDIAEEANPFNLGHHAIYDRGKNQPLWASGSTAITTGTYAKYGFNPNWPRYTIGTVSIATNGIGTLYGTGQLPRNILPGWMLYLGSSNVSTRYSSTMMPAGWYEIVEIYGSNSFKVSPGPSSNQTNQTYFITAGLGNTFIPPFGPWAILKCTECHGSKLSDPAGPHASTNQFLLKDMERTIGYEFFTGTTVVVTTAYNSSGANTKHFCYNCHSRNVYGGTNLISPPSGLYSRVSHTKIYSGDSRTATATFTTTEITCHQCHAVYTRGTGGADGSDRVGGIHGSNYYNKGTGNSTGGNFTSAQGKRLLNGATWLNGITGDGAQGVRRPSTVSTGGCYTRTTITDALNRCNTGHDNRGSIGTAEYDYDNP